MTTATATKVPRICTEQGCDQEAEYAYVWPWGEAGECCGRHRTYLQQKATQQIKRGPLHFTPLDPGRPLAINRDERARLRAEVMVRDEDNAALRSQLVQMHKDLDVLNTEAKRLRGVERHLTEKLRVASLDIAELRKARDELVDELGKVTADRDRLATLARVDARNADTKPE